MTDPRLDEIRRNINDGKPASYEECECLLSLLDSSSQDCERKVRWAVAETLEEAARLLIFYAAENTPSRYVHKNIRNCSRVFKNKAAKLRQEKK